MVFSSISFLFVFLPVVLAAYFLVPKSWKNYCLLIASLIFYAWGEPVYVILMVLSIVFNYACGRVIYDNLDNRRKAKLSLIFAVAVNLSVLALFKYCTVLHLALPIGISFYTFQAISYIADIYMEKAEPQKNPLYFGLYISMFPQLIAGPIVRYVDIEKQLEERRVTLNGFGIGARMFITGLAKKAILANGIGAVFSRITAPGEPTAVLTAWVGAAAYALQIYFDFSGYSDMAIGLGYMLGFRFRENFNLPYIATSITHFWRGWHISLSTWFREYVYIPLGGNRLGRNQQILNLLVVWTLTGIWHGASLNFLFWGFYYGVLLVLEKFVWGKFIEKLPSVLQHIYALLLVLIGWVFFFSDNLGSAFAYLGNMFGAGSTGFADAVTGQALFYHWLLWITAVFACTRICRQLIRKGTAHPKLRWIAAAIYIAVFIFSVSCLITDSFNPFLYFRF